MHPTKELLLRHCVQFLGLQVLRDRPCRVYDYSHKTIAKLFCPCVCLLVTVAKAVVLLCPLYDYSVHYILYGLLSQRPD